jgi:hypothetical protein
LVIGFVIASLLLISGAIWFLLSGDADTTEAYKTFKLQGGATATFPFRLSHSGKVEVSVDQLTPDWDGFSGAKGLPGQDGVSLTICSSESGGPYPSRQ